MTLLVRCRLERPSAELGRRAARSDGPGGFVLEVDLELPARGVSAVFGPSGSGKTTLLRCIAGLEPGARAHVAFGAETWQDGRGHFVPAHRRGVGYVFQDADLFGHLTVRANLDYARRRARPGGVAHGDVVERLGVGPLLDRRPADLSGGERQRVAIARALAANPRLLLMDEPMSALDDASRRRILPYLEMLHDRLSIPVVYVTHSVREIVRLGDHLVWLDRGRVRGDGPLRDVLAEAGFAAALGDEAGVVVDATVAGHDARHHLTRLDGPWGVIHTRGHDAPEGAGVRVRMLARDVSLGLDPEPRSSILNTFPMEVRRLTHEGPGQVLVELGARGDAASAALLARVTTLSRERLALRPGTEVYARVKSVALADE